MRRGELGSSLDNNIGVCIKSLLDPPKDIKEKFSWAFWMKDKRDAKHLWHPRFDNINRIRPLSFRYNLYVFSDLPRAWDGMLRESLQPLGFIGIVHYRGTVGLRQEVERFNLRRFLASSEEQVSVIGDQARLFDLSYQQEKELFK